MPFLDMPGNAVGSSIVSKADKSRTPTLGEQAAATGIAAGGAAGALGGRDLLSSRKAATAGRETKAIQSLRPTAAHSARASDAVTASRLGRKARALRGSGGRKIALGAGLAAGGAGYLKNSLSKADDVKLVRTPSKDQKKSNKKSGGAKDVARLSED